jgi:PAS domain S-box-containing protein
MPSSHASDSSFWNLIEAIVEQAPDAMIYADGDGVIRIWNRAAETLFGFGAAEVLGESLDRIIPERFLRAHWDGFHQALRTGETKYTGRTLTTRSVRKNGDKLYVDLSFSLVRDHAGSVIGALAIARDCTGRHMSGGAATQR